MNIFNQTKTAFGFDLSDASIKMMQLSGKPGNYKVVAFKDYSLPKGVVVNDTIMEEEKALEHIRMALKKMDYGKIYTNQIVASIPESKAFVRVIQIPKMSEVQAAQAVPFEAEQYIPIPIDQTYLDWQLLGERDEKMDVLVTASPKDYIDNYLRVLKNAELQPVAFEVESAACIRALLTENKADKSLLLVDLDASRSSLILVDKGNLQFTSSVPIAGEAFTQSIARALGIPDDQAEKIKREVGLADDREHLNVRQALTPVIDNLISEIRNMLKFHDERSSLPISQIILCGGTAKLLHLSSYMYEKLIDYQQVDIILANPWTNIFPLDSKEQPPLNRADSLSYSTSIGLAMHGANL